MLARVHRAHFAAPLLLLVLVGACACAHGLRDAAGDPSPDDGSSPDTAQVLQGPGPWEDAAPVASEPAPAPAPASPGTAPGPGPTRDAAAIAAIRAGVDAVLHAQGEAVWRAWTGGGRADPAAAWKGHEKLLSKETLARVGRALAVAQGDERRALAALRAFLAGEVLAREIGAAQAKLDAARAAAAFVWDGRAVPLRRATALLAAEPDAPRRAAIARAAAEASAALAPLADARNARLAAAARALGWSSSLALASDLRGAAADALASLADAVLTRTDASYRALLDDLARRELSLSFAALRGPDLPRLFAAAPAPAAFPADRVLDDAARILRGLGLDLARQRHILLDADARAGKASAALALPVDVPGDVRLAVTPAPGLQPLRGILNAIGIAEYYAHVTSPVVEFRRLGSAAIPAAFGRLLEAVAATPAWLDRHGGDADRRGLAAKAAAAERLHRARAAAARVLYEIERARAPDRAAAAWASISERAFGRADAVPEATARAESDPLLRSAEDLRAEVLAAQIEAFLVREAGAEWWRSEKAGTWLRAAWADGGRRTPDEIAAATGAAGLDPAALDALARARGAPAHSARRSSLRHRR